MQQYNYSEKGFGIRLEARLKNAALVRAREQIKLPAVEVAKEIGIPYNSYLFYESMKKYPSKEAQEKICNFYRKRGVFLLEEDVFPEELKQITSKKYKIEREIPRHKLISLNDVSQRLLPYAKDIEKTVYEQQMDEELDNVLKTLTEREEKVIRLKFGFDDGYPRTLEEIGQIFNVTPERIRQIESKALRKLRHPSRGGILKHQIKDRDAE